MRTKIGLLPQAPAKSLAVQVVLLPASGAAPRGVLSDAEQKRLQHLRSRGQHLALWPRGLDLLVVASAKKDAEDKLEHWRLLGFQTWQAMSAQGLETADVSTTLHADLALAFLEGLVLASYRFGGYRKPAKPAASELKQVRLHAPGLTATMLSHLSFELEAVWRCRDLVNEPAATLTSVALGKAFEAMGKEAGFSVEVMGKKKIQALQMGGLLGVNRGSSIPPTFSVMEYKPAKPLNRAPLVLVGKGVVYDTGGLNIKVGNGMETMKCDMAGGAVVASVLYALAKQKAPYHVVGLVPATDNRIQADAYAAGDVLRMHNGTTVEIINTDAEGRLILADALSYASRWKPGLVVDLATLTGAAAVAIGKFGCVGMGTHAKALEHLTQAGETTHERVAPFPFWEEYDELIKGEVADLRNLGGAFAGAITAGKFLSHFVSAPWVHLDIAGPAFVDAPWNYRGKGATGYGVRLLLNFIHHHFTTLS